MAVAPSPELGGLPGFAFTGIQSPMSLRGQQVQQHYAMEISKKLVLSGIYLNNSCPGFTLRPGKAGASEDKLIKLLDNILHGFA